MGQEIERKYLVSGDGWRDGAEGVHYRQGYLNLAKERTVRVRIKGDKAVITVKGENDGSARREYEYEIPVADAQEMLAELCEKPLIDKTRYKIAHAHFTWEVDVFHGENEGLILAEIELEEKDQQFEKPGWIGEDVTDDPRYYNANLVQHPYKEW